MFSITKLGAYVVAISTILGWFGTHIAPENLQTTIDTLSQLGSLIGAIVAWVGRHRHGDTTALGFKL